MPAALARRLPEAPKARRRQANRPAEPRPQPRNRLHGAAERRQRRTVRRRQAQVLLIRDRRPDRSGQLRLGRRRKQGEESDGSPQPARADHAAQPHGAGAHLHGRQQGPEEGADAGLRQGHRPLRRRRLRGRRRTLPAARPRKGHPRDRRLRRRRTYLPHRAAQAPPADQRQAQQAPRLRTGHEGKRRQDRRRRHPRAERPARPGVSPGRGRSAGRRPAVPPLRRAPGRGRRGSPSCGPGCRGVRGERHRRGCRPTAR